MQLQANQQSWKGVSSSQFSSTEMKIQFRQFRIKCQNLDIKLTNCEDRFHSSDDKAVVGGIADSSKDDAAEDEEDVEGDGVVSEAAGDQSEGENPEDSAGEGKWKKFHWKR